MSLGVAGSTQQYLRDPDGPIGKHEPDPVITAGCAFSCAKWVYDRCPWVYPQGSLSLLLQGLEQDKGGSTSGGLTASKIILKSYGASSVDNAEVPLVLPVSIFAVLAPNWIW
jgi:hypothetical protein